MKKRVQRPSQVFFCQLTFLFSKRFPVSLGGILAVGTAIADQGFYSNQRWSVRGITCCGQGIFNSCKVIAILNLLNVPAICFKTLQAVFGKGKVSLALNGNMVIIVEIYKLSEFQVTRQGGSLMGNAFHEITIAYNPVSMVVDNFMARPVKFGCQMSFSYGHANTGCKALSQWTCGRFNSRGVTVFRMAGCFASPLAKIFQLGK